MQPHVKNYYKAFGYSPGDWIRCEAWPCLSTADDIHHVTPRSRFGPKRRHERDAAENLIALCRKHHEQAHASKAFNDSLKHIIANRIFKAPIDGR